MNIPKKIHLTCKDKNNIDNEIWKKCLKEYKLMYPDYEIIVYDNKDIYDIIEKHFPEYLCKIKQIKVGAILADLFRYLILYLEGGIYSDFDCGPIKRIDELLNPNFKYYHGNDNNNYWIYKTKEQIVNKDCDFTDNICINSEIINCEKIPISMKCLGHSMGNISTILGYEFHSDFINIKELEIDRAMGDIYHDAVKKYKFQICQWFMITEPKQNIFLKMFHFILDNIDTLINIDTMDKNYCHTVINLTGPSGFTKIVMDNFTDKIKILPCDFFCCGSWNGAVPLTKNSYVKHYYTGSWLNE